MPFCFLSFGASGRRTRGSPGAGARLSQPPQGRLPPAIPAGARTGFWLFLRRKDLFFYYAVFFVLMVPYINLRFLGIWLADRYLYFSGFCLLALAVSLVLAALQHPGPARRIGVLSLCG